MEISIFEQTITSLLSLILGVFCGVFYDFIKIFRIVLVEEYNIKFKERQKIKVFPKIQNPVLKETSKKENIYKILVISAFDIFYFLSLIPVFCIYTYVMSDGILRWYIFVFALLGVITYKFTLGRLSAHILSYLSYYLHILFLYLMYFIKIPIKKLKNKIKISKKIKNKKKTSQKIIYNFGK